MNGKIKMQIEQLKQTAKNNHYHKNFYDKTTYSEFDYFVWEWLKNLILRIRK
jgi:hypothetical protein